MSLIDQLKNRWKVKNTLQVVLILLVFACTGYSIILVKRLLGINDSTPASYRVAFYICILPIYNILLLCFGFLFGQFRFFLDFEKRFFGRLLKPFSRNK